MDGKTYYQPKAGLEMPAAYAGPATHKGPKDHPQRLHWLPEPPPVAPALNGGKLAGDHYYRVRVVKPISPEVQPYTAECADIIESLNMTFNEGEAFKALWRLAASRQGRGKPGNKAQDDADNVAHYGQRVAAHTQARGEA